MLPAIWSFSVALADWRHWARYVSGRPLLDVVFITNMRDGIDRRRYLGNRRPAAGHFSGPRFSINGIGGRIRVLDSVTEDLLSSRGRKKAREQFISAAGCAEEHGAKVVLLAASTKRLFGGDGRTIKELFPNLVFTIGDNGTMLLLLGETLRAFRKAGLRPGNSRIGILGPYGLLGETMTSFLRKEGYNIIGAGPNAPGLRKMSSEHGIEVCETFAEMGKVDAVVACTHSKGISLAADAIGLIRREGRKLLVIDVAEPSNLIQAEYERCGNAVVRQDAGNAYSPRLKYVLGGASYRMLRLSRGVTFGCFAEALSLASDLERGDDIRNIDWFAVNDENMAIMEGLFRHDGFKIPSPRCYGKWIKSFSLNMEHEPLPVTTAVAEEG